MRSLSQREKPNRIEEEWRNSCQRPLPLGRYHPTTSPVDQVGLHRTMNGPGLIPSLGSSRPACSPLCGVPVTKV